MTTINRLENAASQYKPTTLVFAILASVLLHAVVAVFAAPTVIEPDKPVPSIPKYAARHSPVDDVDCALPQTTACPPIALPKIVPPLKTAIPDPEPGSRLRSERLGWCIFPSNPPPIYPTPCPRCKTVHAEHNEAVCLLRRSMDINQTRASLESHSAKPKNNLPAGLLMRESVIGRR